MRRAAARDVRALKKALTALGRPERARGERTYLKSSLEFLGVDAAGIRGTARAFVAARPDLTRADITTLVEALWRTRCHELWQVGTALLERTTDRLSADDLALVERLLRRAQSWAHVDFLATAVAAPLVLKSGRSRRYLDRWARDEGFWIRRAALLALLPPLRRGAGDFDQFVRYAVPMLGEDQFFIRKAIGWVLREISKKRPALVAAFLRDHASQVSGLTYREATKYLPLADRRNLDRLRAAGGMHERRASRPSNKAQGSRLRAQGKPSPVNPSALSLEP